LVYCIAIRSSRYYNLLQGYVVGGLDVIYAMVKLVVARGYLLLLDFKRDGGSFLTSPQFITKEPLEKAL